MFLIQQFPEPTSMGSLPGNPLENTVETPQNTAEPRRTLEEIPAGGP